MLDLPDPRDVLSHAIKLDQFAASVDRVGSITSIVVTDPGEEDETVYEEASTVDPPSQTIPLPTSPKKIDTVTTESPSKISNCKHSVSKPKNVSDAQRARIASEPVALLREKLAKQYGIAKKN